MNELLSNGWHHLLNGTQNLEVCPGSKSGVNSATGVHKNSVVGLKKNYSNNDTRKPDKCRALQKCLLIGRFENRFINRFVHLHFCNGKIGVHTRPYWNIKRHRD